LWSVIYLKGDYERYPRYNEPSKVERVDEQEEALIEHLLSLDKGERRGYVDD